MKRVSQVLDLACKVNRKLSTSWTVFYTRTAHILPYNHLTSWLFFIFNNVLTLVSLRACGFFVTFWLYNCKEATSP